MSRRIKLPFGRWIAGAVCVAALYGSVPATITDDVTPLGYNVLVTLLNPDSHPSSGVVVATVVVDGAKTTSSASFRVNAGERTSVRVPFSGKVTDVVTVSIIDDEPDPMEP